MRKHILVSSLATTMSRSVKEPNTMTKETSGWVQRTMTGIFPYSAPFENGQRKIFEHVQMKVGTLGPPKRKTEERPIKTNKKKRKKQKAKESRRKEKKGNSQRRKAKEQFRVSGHPINHTINMDSPLPHPAGHLKEVSAEKHPYTMNVKEMHRGINTMIPIGATSILGQTAAGSSTTTKAWEAPIMPRQNQLQTVARDIVASHLRDPIGECRAIQHEVHTVLLDQQPLGRSSSSSTSESLGGERNQFLNMLLTVSRERT